MSYRMYQTTKMLKGLDILGQVCCVLVPMIIHMRLPDGYMGILMMVGGWQLLSFFVHLFFKNEPWKVELRRTYAKLLIIVAGALLLGLWQPAVMFTVVFGWIYAGPVVGLIYLGICIVEWMRVRRMAIEPKTEYNGTIEKLEGY
jgi:hypothetical protein